MTENNQTYKVTQGSIYIYIWVGVTNLPILCKRQRGQHETRNETMRFLQRVFWCRTHHGAKRQADMFSVCSNFVLG